MKKVPLVVRDPEALDKGMPCERMQMTYADTGLPIVFDTEKLLLECEPLNKAAPFLEWLVDFDNHKMKLAGDIKEDQAEDGYSPTDLLTSVSMIGQMVQYVGLQTLKDFLESLKGSGDNPNVPEKSLDEPTPSTPVEPPKSHR